MASISKGYTFGTTEQVTAAKLHSLVDSATLTSLVNADISATAAIVDTKLGQIATAGKVNGSALVSLGNTPTDAGVFPVEVLPSVATTPDSDATLTFTDITTNNASTSKHGFLKKLSNVATEFMNGVGNWVAVTIDSILPSQTDNSGKYLTTNGSASSWESIPALQVLTADTTKAVLIAQANTSRTNNDASYTKRKEIALAGTGSVYVSFTLAFQNAGFARIYKNGSAVGTVRTTAGTFDEIVSSVVPDDLIQIYGYATNGNSWTVSNFKIYAVASTSTVNLD